MPVSRKWKPILDAVVWLLFLIAGISFWFGGRALHEFWKIDRVPAEFFGIGVATASGIFGYLIKSVSEESTGQEGNN